MVISDANLCVFEGVSDVFFKIIKISMQFFISMLPIHVS